MAGKVSCVNSAKLATGTSTNTGGYQLRYKLYTNVLDFTGNRTVPSMDNSNAACPLPYCTRTVYGSKIRALVPQSTVPTVLPY